MGGQAALAHSGARCFRPFWYNLELHLDNDNGELRCTARDCWRTEQVERAAGHLASRIHLQSRVRPAKGPLLHKEQDLVHVSLIGSFCGKEGQYILQQDDTNLDWLGTDLMKLIGDPMSAQLSDMQDETMDVGYAFFTLRLYHSRQAGFSDQELECFSKLFSGLPIEFIRTADEEGMSAICEPRWRLISPSAQVSVQWHILLEHLQVAELAEVCRI